MRRTLLKLLIQRCKWRRVEEEIIITIYKQRKVETINIDTPDFISLAISWKISSPVSKKKIENS